jgi:hypothetical protein
MGVNDGVKSLVINCGLLFSLKLPLETPLAPLNIYRIAFVMGAKRLKGLYTKFLL